MARTKRLRIDVAKLLYDRGQLNSRPIHDYINQKSKWGATMSQITNVLSKDPKFEKLKGMERVGNTGKFSSKYSVCVWQLSELERNRIEGQNDDNNKV